MTLREAVAAYIEAKEAPSVRTPCVSIACDACGETWDVTDPKLMAFALALPDNEMGYVSWRRATDTHGEAIFDLGECRCDLPWDFPGWLVEETECGNDNPLWSEIPARYEAVKQALKESE